MSFLGDKYLRPWMRNGGGGGGQQPVPNVLPDTSFLSTSLPPPPQQLSLPANNPNLGNFAKQFASTQTFSQNQQPVTTREPNFQNSSGQAATSAPTLSGSVVAAPKGRAFNILLDNLRGGLALAQTGAGIAAAFKKPKKQGSPILGGGSNIGPLQPAQGVNLSPLSSGPLASGFQASPVGGGSLEASAGKGNISELLKALGQG